MFDYAILYAMLLFMPFSADAFDVVFPPLSGNERSQKPVTNDDGIDITIGSDFSGLMTFANLPYANCFKALDMDAYDIAIMGAPFDTVSSPHQLAFPVRYQKCDWENLLVYESGMGKTEHCNAIRIVA